MEQPLQLPETVESHGGVRDSVDMAERDDGSCAAVLKRKRGRPAKGVPKTTTPLVRQKKDEEDVCFICFDGGSLVLCDRRGCPKAYHATCIKRDEAFFRSKAKWNCGWHICSDCGKAVHYMCYTCTYSLCKGCTKDADFVCVRGNKGLCGICMKTILLIENSAQGNKTTCEVDFDDKGSWEYLFKVYWMYLKEKLSLTFDELLQAKKPWKGATSMNCKVQAPHELHHLKDDKGSGSENSCIDIESNNLKNKKPRRRDHVGHSTQDVPTACESAVNCVTDAIVVRPEASDVAKDISSLFLSKGMEQPIDDFLNDKLWHYLDPTGKVQGPFSAVQLFKWNATGHFPPDLRIWRVDENQDNSILLADALGGKCSRNMFLPCNSQQPSSGASFILGNKDNSEDDGSNATRSGLCANRQSVEHSGEQKVDDTCAQSNGKDESIRSNEWNSQSPCFTIQADGNNNEGQSGNFERREESSKCEISCNNQPHVYHSLPSTALSEELNENPCDKLLEDYLVEENTEGNGNDGLNKISEGQSNGGQSHQKRSDCEENSGQSSDQNWRGPNETHPVTLTLFEIFGDESSVPDFLAEVEAMKSLGDLEFPTSNMKCGEELADGSIADCLSFEDGLSPILDAVKGDALSSSADLQFPSQSTAPVEPFGQAVVHHDHQIISGEHSSRSSEVKSTFPRTSWNQTVTNQYSWGPNR